MRYLDQFLPSFLILLFTGSFLSAQPARVQIIHNAPDPVVDIYVNGSLLLNDFAFRTATPFIDVPADVALTVSVAPATSTSVADALADFPVTFESGKTYTVMAAGVVGNTGNTAFSLFVNDQAREAAANNALVDITAFHGSPDAPAVDVDATFVANNVISNLSFGEFTPYLGLPPAKYDLAVRPAGVNSVVASFRADLSGLAGGAATVFASGYLSNSPSFGLFAALPNGTVLALPLTPTARLQVIHNSPEPTVDVYAGNTRLLNDFAFRTATPFIDVPADREINIGIATASSTSAADAIANFPVTLATGGTYVVMAAGVVGNTGNTALSLFVNDQARETSNSPANVALALFHGSPDAPEVDVRLPNGPVLFDNIEFGEFSSYLDVPASPYTIYVTPSNDNNTVVAAYLADVTTLAGQAITVFASGYLSGQTPVFGVWVALPNGTTFPLQTTVSTQQMTNTLRDLSIAPNPASEMIRVQFDLDKNTSVLYRVMDATGRTALQGNLGQLSSGVQSVSIPLERLTSGSYFLQLTTPDGSRTEKIVVKK